MKLRIHLEGIHVDAEYMKYKYTVNCLFLFEYPQSQCVFDYLDKHANKDKSQECKSFNSLSMSFLSVPYTRTCLIRFLLLNLWTTW